MTKRKSNDFIYFRRRGKNYVVFEFDETEEVSAARFEPTQGEGIGQLMDIETEAEWDLVENVFNQYEKDLEDEELED